MNKLLLVILTIMLAAPSIAGAEELEIDQNNEFFKSFKQDIADKNLLDDDLLKDLNALSEQVKTNAAASTQAPSEGAAGQ